MAHDNSIRLFLVSQLSHRFIVSLVHQHAR